MAEASTTNDAHGGARAKNGTRKRSFSRWAKRILLAAAVIGVGAWIVIAVRPKPIGVETATVTRGPLEVTIDEVARTRVKDRYVVSAPLVGHLARIELHASDVVRAGQVVARIAPLAAPLLDPRARETAEATVSEARARQEQARFSVARAIENLQFAEREHGRVRQLGEQGSASQRELDRAELELATRRGEVTSARFAVTVADHELQIAQATLGRVRGTAQPVDEVEVTSPIDGRVLRVVQESASAVAAGTPLLEIGDTAQLEVVTDLLTTDAVDVRPGAHAHIERWGEAHVRLVQLSAFTKVSALGVEEQRVNALLDLDSPPASRTALGDGFRVEAHITVWRGEDVVQAPASALFRSGDGWALFTVQGGVAHEQRVQVGHRNRDDVEIVSGVARGAVVVIYPNERVVDGAEVSPYAGALGRSGS